MTEPVPILVLGGTAEAAALATRLYADQRLLVTTSLAGRTRDPAPLSGEVRIGGFGGVDGLRSYLERQGVALLIDATHPFAAQITAQAAEACSAIGLPRLRLIRPAWQRRAGDDWYEVASLAEAADLVSQLGRRVFLSIGRQDLAAFADRPDCHFLVRMIDPPDALLPLADHEVVLGRGPFAEEAEAALLETHGIETLIAKNSGGAATYGKIAAARRLGLPVILIRRPDELPGDKAATVEQAETWIGARLSEGALMRP